MSHFYPDIHCKRLAAALERIERELIIESRVLAAEFAVTPEPTPHAEREGLAYRAISEGEEWGRTWDCGWFRLRGEVPAEWAGAYVTLQLDFSGEALVYDAAGCPMVGLSDGSVFHENYNKDRVHLIPSCKGGEKLDLWVETGASGLFGVERAMDPRWVDEPARVHGHFRAVVKRIRVCRFDYELWQLGLDLQVLDDLARALPENAVRRMQLLRQASRALDLWPSFGTQACREALRPIFELPTDPATVDVYGVGHAHIDTGWLWPVRETIRKCSRSFANQIGLIERYPEYIFGASQAQHYEFVKQHYPPLYEKIRQAVAAGRWEVQGGMWVEADCNLISGESMVRQFLHGKNFFRDEFGVEVRNLWLPDVFGYSGNLPQILRRGGMDFFLTQKMSWNAYNRFPHNTFIWRGIDGSEVLSHFPPENSYNSPVLPERLRRNETESREAGLVREAICLFGVGDGGGGPKEEHIERGLRLRNLNGCPRFHFAPAQTAFDKLAAYQSELDTWEGELYFEYHRGTLTSQAAIKLWNRRAEEALRAAEMLCAAAGTAAYPLAEFDALWKIVLINQFHDIIPGSSIKRVYDEAIPQLQQVVARCKELQVEAAGRLLEPAAKTLTLFNPSSTVFEGCVALPVGWQGAKVAGAVLDAQVEDDIVQVRVEVPPQSFVTLVAELVAESGHCHNANANADTNTNADGGLVLENERVRYAFDENLRLVNAFDKEAGREIVTDREPGNLLEIFDDHPHEYDAWEIEEYAYGMKLGEAESVEPPVRLMGALRDGLLGVLRVGSSTIRQRIWLEKGSKRLDFVTEVDWREDHKLLRVAFPTTIVAQDARFEIQYGFVSRPTHDNTSWQWAQFEVCGHRFADISERDCGVALLNDCKYGYRAKGRELSLSLLRAPTDPDPECDRGRHRFTYSLLPHAGMRGIAEVCKAAAELNQGLERFEGLAVRGGQATGSPLPVKVTGEGVELAVLKRAEREDALVVRVVETQGVRTRMALECDAAWRMQECDLMEWNGIGEPAEGRMEVEMGAFEIRTFKLLACAEDEKGRVL